MSDDDRPADSGPVRVALADVLSAPIMHGDRTVFLLRAGGRQVELVASGRGAVDCEAIDRLIYTLERSKYAWGLP